MYSVYDLGRARFILYYKEREVKVDLQPKESGHLDEAKRHAEELGLEWEKIDLSLTDEQLLAISNLSAEAN